MDRIEAERAKDKPLEDEAQKRFLSELDYATRELTDRQEITRVAAQILGEHLRGDSTERTRVARELGERERSYRFLAESIPQMVWTATPDGALDYVNGQGEAYFQAKREVLYKSGWLEWVHSEDRDRTVACWLESLTTGRPYETAFRLLRRADESWRWHLVRALPMIEKGSIVRWFGTCTDIHNQRTTEDELRRVNRELEEFAYVASHDLQEPLRVVNIYSHLISKKLEKADGQIGQYVSFVREGVTRMEALIQDLLTFSRTVQKDEQPIGLADLGVALAEAFAVLKSRVEESGAEITAEPLPTVRGDVAQLSHVFQNLLSNSLKYRNPNVPPKISINASKEGDHWTIAVRDNGIGFEQQYAERIFGLFKRLHKDEYPGTGLGLAICERIVKRYGGRMWAESQAGEGAAFYFSLAGVAQ